MSPVVRRWASIGTAVAWVTSISPWSVITSGFDWTDWAIGIGSGIGVALLLGAGLVTSREVRQRVRTA